MADRPPESDAEHPSVLKLTPVSLDAEDDEPMGGDPPCWAHLFEDDSEGA
jgi:hypothetical protein